MTKMPKRPQARREAQYAFEPLQMKSGDWRLSEPATRFAVGFIFVLVIYAAASAFGI